MDGLIGKKVRWQRIPCTSGLHLMHNCREDHPPITRAGSATALPAGLVLHHGGLALQSHGETPVQRVGYRSGRSTVIFE